MLGTNYERDYACTALELTEPPYQQTTAQGFGTCMLHVAAPAVGFCAHSTAAGRAAALNERCITTILNQWCITSNQPMQNAHLLFQGYSCIHAHSYMYASRSCACAVRGYTAYLMLPSAQQQPPG